MTNDREEKKIDLQLVREVVEKALANATTVDGKVKFIKISKLDGDVN